MAVSGDEVRRIVRHGYDACARRYAEARAPDADEAVTRLLHGLRPGSRILDIGCGSGVPVTQALAAEHRVTGVDVSGEQIALARSALPAVRWIRSDIMHCEFDRASFDAAVAYYALFHVPREEHAELIRRLAGWIAPGGRLLLTLAASSIPGSTEADFFGVSMHWSALEPAEYDDLLGAHGFVIRERGMLGHGYRPDLELPAERHPYVGVVRGEDEPLESLSRPTGVE